MDDMTARRLLREVRRTAAALDTAKAERNTAIVAAMEAGIPRAEIAKAATLSTQRLKQIRRECLNDPTATG